MQDSGGFLRRRPTSSGSLGNIGHLRAWPTMAATSITDDAQRRSGTFPRKLRERDHERPAAIRGAAFPGRLRAQGGQLRVSALGILAIFAARLPGGRASAAFPSRPQAQGGQLRVSALAKLAIFEPARQWRRHRSPTKTSKAAIAAENVGTQYKKAYPPGLAKNSSAMGKPLRPWRNCPKRTGFRQSIPLTMANPSPLPPPSRERALSTR